MILLSRIVLQIYTSKVKNWLKYSSVIELFVAQFKKITQKSSAHFRKKP